MTVAEDQQTPSGEAERGAESTDTTCPVCGAGAERGQLICLECGSRIALRHRRPPSWKVPVGIVLGVTILAAAGGVLAYEALDADARREADAAPPRVADAERGGAAGTDSGGAPSEEAEGGGGDEPSLGDAAPGQTDAPSGGDEQDSLLPDESEAGADSAEPDAADQTEDAGAAPAGELVPAGELFTWPRSLSGVTVVVQSNEDNASATAFARSVAQSTDGQVGVISSEDFRTIPEGFFVVFVGRYEGRPAAERAAVRLGRTYPGAFPQDVRR